ncbi:hypothetical protein [Nocardia sp. NPDC050793]|uniref:hypothetical protein n=1 Tax=Nocardia sp. NPDC050793 TaxID=3155159 RepID=UPI0033C4A9E1
MYGLDDDEVLLEHLSCQNTDYPSSTLRAAHRSMQVHRECLVGQCPAKTAAFGKLKRDGHLVPDSSRVRE